MLKEILQFLKDSAPNDGRFWWLIYLPSLLALLTGLTWIFFLFPEWKRDMMMVFFLLLVVALATAGVYSISFGVFMAKKVDWQIASGIVVSSSIKKNEDWRSTNDSRSLSGTKTDVYYVPYIECRYNVAGKEYSAEMVAGDGTTGSGEAQSVLDKEYPAGKEITFFYDPGYPENAVIEIPSFFSRTLALIIGLLLTSGGLFVGWILMVNLYSDGKTVDIGKIFRVPVRLEYRVNRAVIKIFNMPESEQQKLESYMKYLKSLNDYIENRGNYSKLYTQDRVIGEQIKTLERLVEITKNDPSVLIAYCEGLYDVSYRKNRLGDARSVIIKIRDKFPAQFNSSYWKDKLAPDSTVSK
jgi:hypothetical protein